LAAVRQIHLPSVTGLLQAVAFDKSNTHLAAVHGMKQNFYNFTSQEQFVFFSTSKWIIPYNLS